MFRLCFQELCSVSSFAFSASCSVAKGYAKGKEERRKMRTVASNNHYVIAVDEAKNRVYFTMKGRWVDTQEVPRWIDDCREAFRYVRPGFTELIDWTEVSSILLTDYIAGAQKLAMEGGLRRAARVYSSESFLKVQMDSLSEKTQFPVRSFSDQAEAEKWLDEDS
jgi:hypothetical protein